MRRQLAFAVLALCLVPSLTVAATFPVPAKNPIATVTIPDGWNPKVSGDTVEAASGDGSIYVAFDSVEAADADGMIDAFLDSVKGNGDEVDRASKKTKDVKINNLDASEISYTGKDKEGPTVIKLTLIKTNAPSKVLLFSYWASTSSEATYEKDLQAISSGIQATK
jgi:hypothetical protein